MPARRSHRDHQDINSIRFAAVAREFRESAGRRALLLIEAFPFLVIGEIVSVISDFVLMMVETTHISELEGRQMRIHLDNIKAFFIENGDIRIPKIE